MSRLQKGESRKKFVLTPCLRPCPILFLLLCPSDSPAMPLQCLTRQNISFSASYPPASLLFPLSFSCLSPSLSPLSPLFPLSIPLYFPSLSPLLLAGCTTLLPGGLWRATREGGRGRGRRSGRGGEEEWRTRSESVKKGGEGGRAIRCMERRGEVPHVETRRR